MKKPKFESTLLGFLRELKTHNNRDWFAQNKDRYESLVREPALDFIAAMGPELDRIAPQFEAVAKKTGGSMMRVHRDMRFGHNSEPFKTNVGIQFRHSQGKDIHAPGYYVHIEPGENFIGVGMWRPEPAALARIRDAIVERTKEWKAAREAAPFKRAFEFSGDSLARTPRGYDPQHPMADDLKRKSFIAMATIDDDEVLRPDFFARTVKRFDAATPLMKFLCRAVGVPF